MNNIKKNRKDQWEKIRVQRVLDYCNKKNGTHLKILGKSEEVDPNLKGQINYDWVCKDIHTKDEIAAEVKRITDPQKEQKYNIIYKSLTEVQEIIKKLNILPGTYSLHPNIQLKETIPFRNKGNKKEFIDTVLQVICNSAKSMKKGEENLITPHIKQKLSFQLPNLISLTLRKISAKGSVIIGMGFGIMGSYPIKFNDNELSEFQERVSHANEQLGKSKARKTMLVIIEEGLRHAIPATVKDAFSKIKPDCYSNINSVYFVQGEEVEEIHLPK